MNRPFLPFAIPTIDEAEEQAVLEALRSGWLTTGPKVRAFEQALCAYTGAPYAVAVNSCTAALHLVLAAWGIGVGDEVITTPLTFCATIEAIEYVGATPVLADIDPRTGNIDPQQIERALTPRTHAIIPVHYGGLPCDMAEIMDIAERRQLRVLEDAAHAIGAEYRGRKIGVVGHATAFSFYANKNMTTGEGGAITTADPELADRCRILSLHGISRDAWKRYTATGSWYYEVEMLGYKYNLTDIQAAIGLAQLQKLDAMNQRRAQIAARYRNAFAEMDFLEPFPLTLPEDRTHVWHLFTIVLNLDALRIDRAQFIEELRTRQIGVSVHYIPIHYHPHYRGYGWQRGQFPHAERYYERTISLPLYPAMDDADVDYVIEAVYEIGKHYRR
ncbi:MAG: UDP-4-amino-4,6-dideoxy-N-acetyl-beta-L-altrosamine transaminase [Fimbriimonadales bacterium]|jgi:UDP-4-amino-4,6-dideoxy-N-acetyl-beta-L-altrosamine transaminase|nr:UDP-4-amino-4,6-dideoxy-N-acetyl-beta-L-altrosamine transaminase [Fimbriimonadales bacterium]GBC90645.1 UDP-4-amino-4-deoxy-L-arabinose--oxoglutarate aminotransferase [bacterium HR14]